MYIPDHFKNENREEILEFIHKNAFAVLVNQVDGKLWATHIPLFLCVNGNGKEVLQGHVAKNNPQSATLVNGQEVLAVFSGPHAYISSSWYDHENVPTWNYIAVHVYGTVKVLDLEQSMEALTKLVDKYEVNSEKPVKVSELSPETMAQVNGIVVFEIEISKIEGVNKMSQNRSDKNYQNIIQNLENQNDVGSKEVAQKMKDLRK